MFLLELQNTHFLNTTNSQDTMPEILDEFLLSFKIVSCKPEKKIHEEHHSNHTIRERNFMVQFNSFFRFVKICSENKFPDIPFTSNLKMLLF